MIALAIGWSEQETGYDEIVAAVKKAEASGVLLVSSSIGRSRNMFFNGLGRDPLADPDAPSSYRPGAFWADMITADDGDITAALRHWVRGKMERQGGKPADKGVLILVPMDSRTTASPTGTSQYVFYRQGGWSWSIPYIAGLYALAAQVHPAITPERFWQLAAETGTHIEWQQDGKAYKLGPIVNPAALIESVRDGRPSRP